MEKIRATVRGDGVDAKHEDYYARPAATTSPEGARNRPLPALLLRLPGLGAVVATSVSRTAAQARLAALPLEAPAPADNPTTPERVALGRLLFWDPILSGQKDVACATCHHPAFGYSDGLDLSIGANGAGLGPGERSSRAHAAPGEA